MVLESLCGEFICVIHQPSEPPNDRIYAVLQGLDLDRTMGLVVTCSLFGRKLGWYFERPKEKFAENPFPPRMAQCCWRREADVPKGGWP